MEPRSESEFLEKKRANNDDILSVSFHNIKAPKIDGTSSTEKIPIKSQPNSDLKSSFFSEEKLDDKNVLNISPKKIDQEKKKNTNDLFMSQFMSGMDKESDELFKMIKGAIDEDPSQKLIAQQAISNPSNTNTDINKISNTNINTTSDNSNNKYDIEEFNKSVEAELAKQNALLENPNINLNLNNNSNNNDANNDINTDNNNDINTNDNTEKDNNETLVENPPYEPELDALREKVEEKLEKVFEKNLAERQALEAEKDKMFEEKRDGLQIDYEEELYDDLNDDLIDIDADDIVNSEAFIDFYYPKTYTPNFESPVFTIVSVLMDKYGFNLISDMIVRNDKKKRVIVEKKDYMDNDDTTFNINKKDENDNNDELNQAQMDIEQEDKKEEQKDESILKVNVTTNTNEILKDLNNENNLTINENKVEEKKEDNINQAQIPTQNDQQNIVIEEKKDEVNNELNMIPNISNNNEGENNNNEENMKKMDEETAQFNMDINEENMNINNGDGINMEGIEKLEDNGINPNSQEQEQNQNENQNENQNQNVSDNQMHTDINNEISQNFAMDNSSILSQENVPLNEEELRIKNILTSLVTLSGFTNVVFFTLQYGKYLKNIQKQNSSQFSDDGFEDEEFLSKEEQYTNELSDNEINKMRKIEHYAMNFEKRRRRRQKLEKMKKSTTYTKKEPDIFENKKNYYEKGGRVGMHYHTSEDDGNIYKYYCVQYNNDGTVGFKCTEPNCRSKALMDPRKKTFTIISKHMLSFKEHKKLHGCYLRDRYIKFMMHKKIREVQLTKKNDKKIIEWYK